MKMDSSMVHEHVEGVYVVSDVNLDEPGFWEAEFEVKREGIAETTIASAAFEVREKSIAPGVGDSAPASRSPTIRDVEDLNEISTHPSPVAGLYQLTIAEALEQRKPLVVAFSTPALLRQPRLWTGDGPRRVAIRDVRRPNQLYPRRALGTRNRPRGGEARADRRGKRVAADERAVGFPSSMRKAASRRASRGLSAKTSWWRPSKLSPRSAPAPWSGSDFRFSLTQNHRRNPPRAIKLVGRAFQPNL